MGEPAVGRQRDAERTKAELLEVATQVFAQDGFSGARVDEIARRTRTTKRMIYYYFGGKEQLYLAVLESAYRGIRDVEQGLDVATRSPSDAVRRVAEATFDYHHRHPDFIRLVSIENIHRGEYVRKIPALAELGNPAVGVLEAILRRGADEGVFRKDVDAVDVHLLISSFCVFQVANVHTFGFLFGRDLAAEAERSRMRAMIGDVVVGWLTAPLSA